MNRNSPQVIKTQMGRRIPWLMGGTTADAVAKKVIKALRTDPPRMIVERPVLRIFFAISHVFPRLGEWFTHKVATRFFRRLATQRNGEPSPASSPDASTSTER